MIVGSTHHFPYDCRGKSLLNLVSLRLIDERGNSNGADIGGNGVHAPGSVVAATREKKCHDHDSREGSFHWILPRGRVAAMVSAHSTAVVAAILRLSAAAHSQTPLRSFGSGFTLSRMLACPATLTLLGASSAGCAILTCSPDKAWKNCSTSTIWSMRRWIANPYPWKIGACNNSREGNARLLPPIR